MERQVQAGFESLCVLGAGAEGACKRFLCVSSGLPELGDPTSYIGDETFGVLTGHLAKVASRAREEYKVLGLYLACRKLMGKPLRQRGRPRGRKESRLSARVHLLVVEDQELFRSALVRIFRRFQVVACATLAEGERALSTTAFDAVISDVELPDGSGVDWFHRVRAARPAQAERFVFASGAADDPRVSAALEATGRPFVQKPFAVQSFVELVTSVIERRRPCAISGSYRVGRRAPHV